MRAERNSVRGLRMTGTEGRRDDVRLQNLIEPHSQLMHARVASEVAASSEGAQAGRGRPGNIDTGDNDNALELELDIAHGATAELVERTGREETCRRRGVFSWRR